jgi:hypothetical protein
MTSLPIRAAGHQRPGTRDRPMAAELDLNLTDDEPGRPD